MPFLTRLCLAILLPAATPSLAQPLVLTSATVYDGTRSADPLADATLLIENGRIVCVGTDCDIQEGTETVGLARCRDSRSARRPVERSINGEELLVATPESVGMSSERLARIGPRLDTYVERGEVPGFVTLVARKGKIVHWEAHGCRTLDVEEPMPKNAVFDMASMTKPITAVSAMMLYEEGRLRMLEPISTYLPEFDKPEVVLASSATEPALRPITLHDLLTHTSGVDDPVARVDKFAYPTLADHMHDLAQAPLRFQPGTAWLYGDSHDVLGYLVEVVSGQRLDQFWQDRIFDPLGMTDTYYWLPPEEMYRRAVLLQDGTPDPEMTSRYPAIASERGTYFRGAGGLQMAALDYWRFCQMLLNGGQFNGVRLLSPRTVAWMTTNHLGDLELPAWVPPGSGFGLGMAVILDPASAVAPVSKGTYYWFGALGTSFWIDPEQELIGVILAQVRPNDHLAYRSTFQTLVYAALIE